MYAQGETAGKIIQNQSKEYLDSFFKPKMNEYNHSDIQGMKQESIGLNTIEYGQDGHGTVYRVSIHPKLANLMELFILVAAKPQLANQMDIAIAN